jgi:hypothetical protein
LVSHARPDSSFDHFGALFVKKLVAAVGAKKLDLLVPELLIVTIKFALALRAGYPENFRHNSLSQPQNVLFTTKSTKDTKELFVETRRPLSSPAWAGENEKGENFALFVSFVVNVAGH